MNELEWKLVYPLEDDTAIKKIERRLNKKLPVEFSKVIIEFMKQAQVKENFEQLQA